MADVPIDWKPASFDFAAEHLALARSASGRHPEALGLLLLIIEAIDTRADQGELPYLSCPPPASDPDGRCRVALRWRQPIIERLDDDGEWRSLEAHRETLVPAEDLGDSGEA